MELTDKQLPSYIGIIRISSAWVVTFRQFVWPSVTLKVITKAVPYHLKPTPSNVGISN